MDSKKVIITQSNYIPWKGYFDSIRQVDVFVVYDDMQYTRRDWRNRNLIKTPHGLKWLTIPVEVKGKYYQRINETKISEKEWVTSHLNMLKQNYSKSKHFIEIFDWIENLYHKASKLTYLTDVNVLFLTEICTFFDIKTEFIDSREFELLNDKTDRLVDICKRLEATEYLTGPAAKSYLDETKFVNENINVSYLSYDGYSEYTQLNPPFEHGVSIIDVLFNCGKESYKFLKQ